MAESISSDVQNESEVLRILSNLFGVRWDRLVQWSAVALASGWLWLSAMPSMAAHPDNSFERGPIDWLIQGLIDLGFAVPQWLNGTPAWLMQPGHAWVVQLLPIVAALCGTLLAKSQSSSGLVALGVLAMATSVQATSDFAPVLWTLVWTSVPMVLALSLSAIQTRFHQTDTAPPSQAYVSTLIFERYLLAGLAPIWQVFLGPAIGVALAVSMYGVSRTPEEPTRELIRTRISKLRRSGRTVSEAGAADALGVLAAILLAKPDRQSRQQLAADALFALDGPMGAEIVAHQPPYPAGTTSSGEHHPPGRPRY
ncbi:hypothetical protein J2X55_000432 [Microbacterium sp. 1154]|uniref:hypothetical protein n=1 Tax=Microbacterium sp. 1154 TaxID=2817733 RepID=UPI0028620831|nr:hypothetical protein [Microbacterium sp. 1154]MDR6689533.1 hypothetical protein [Microbacterium sp. 1154]